jgi:hypothetical protein
MPCLGRHNPSICLPTPRGRRERVQNKGQDWRNEHA